MVKKDKVRFFQIKKPALDKIRIKNFLDQFKTLTRNLHMERLYRKILHSQVLDYLNELNLAKLMKYAYIESVIRKGRARNKLMDFWD